METLKLTLAAHSEDGRSKKYNNFLCRIKQSIESWMELADDQL
jgi:hypothetical protein